MSVINATPLLAAAGGDYQISRSVRLRSSASAYFNRTPASASNRTTWTWSGWVKRATLSTTSAVFGAVGSSSVAQIRFSTTDRLNFNFGDTGTNYFVTTTQVFRDVSSWYHIVFVSDTSNATAANRCKVYVNGIEVTAFVAGETPSGIPQNRQSEINTATAHYIGRDLSSGYFDGYLTEVNFIDGQALTPSSFGETDSITGVWKPKKYAGTYGTNGFYLNFSDPSAATAAAIGKDYSGNGNNWTPNNISVTAGVTYDSMLDVPTLWADGGNGRGNYCTLNPLVQTTSTLSEGNLRISTPTSGGGVAFGTIGVSTGKWYWEATVVSLTFSSTAGFGISYKLTGRASDYLDSPDADVFTNTTMSANDVYSIRLDCDNNTVQFFKNNSAIASAVSITSGLTWFPSFSDEHGGDSCVMAVNFGQRPFAYTPPTGFKALNTQNLPEPTIKKGNQYFDATLYTGSGAARSITGVGFQPDFLWLKSRSIAASHILVDSVRGPSQELSSNDTSAETTNTGRVTSLNSDGWSFGATTAASLNQSTATYVGWQWKESPSAGFDIVTYTGTGANRTVSHSLGVAPAMMIVKNRTTAGEWWHVYHQSLGATKAVFLNSTNAAGTSIDWWNNTAPTSSVFTVNTSGAVNGSGASLVAYLFAEVAGFSKFGSYTGNGSADGPFVFCGFRPRFILVKRATTDGAAWNIVDTSRSSFNVSNAALYPNLSNAEASANVAYDILSNGFKVRDGVSGDDNLNGATYIYAAFAESPFKNSLAR